MAVIKIKLKIGTHKPETLEIDDSIDEERILYDNFIEKFLEFQKNIGRFKYSSNTSHPKTKKFENVVDIEELSWSEFKERIRYIIDDNLLFLEEVGKFKSAQIKILYKKRFGPLPLNLDTSNIIREVLSEYKKDGILISQGERINTTYRVLTDKRREEVGIE